MHKLLLYLDTNVATWTRWRGIPLQCLRCKIQSWETSNEPRTGRVKQAKNPRKSTSPNNSTKPRNIYCKQSGFNNPHSILNKYTIFTRTVARVTRYLSMTILKKVRDFLTETRSEFLNSNDIDFSKCVLVFGNESTGNLMTLAD